MRVLCSTLVHLNDFALWLFMMGAELFFFKYIEGAKRLIDRGEETPVDVLFLRVTQERHNKSDSHLKRVHSSSRLASRPLFTFLLLPVFSLDNKSIGEAVFGA